MEDFLFEISWEVVNKVGGIYTVLRSKAKTMMERTNMNYYLIGPYTPQFAETEFEKTAIDHELIKNSISSMTDSGIKVYHGRWLIPGYPKVILFDLLSGYPHIDGWRHELAEKANIFIPVFDKECSDVLVFGSLVSWFINEVRNRVSSHILCHFHEWLSSVGLIFLRKRNVNVALVFSAHATLLGRHLASGSSNLYGDLRKFNVDEESGKRQIYHQYCIERAGVHCSHVFTTVSGITNEEAGVFLSRSADVITPNGLNVDKYIDSHELRNLHSVAKRKINNFVVGHFFGHYHFSLEKTLYFFSAGRYEFSNKGVDIFIEALARLNHLLKINRVDVTVVVFLIFQASHNSYNVESLRGQAQIKQLWDCVKTIQAKIGGRIFDIVTKRQLPSNNDMINPDEMVQLRRFIVASRNEFLPPVCTHNMVDDANDPILCNIRRTRLFNRPEDKVKIVFHPEFLSAAKPLFSIDYDEFVKGCHLGVFPSYYEPYGYTPAECTVMGIPSVSTNLSGFGQFMEKQIKRPEDFGVYILDRRFQSVDNSINELCKIMMSFCCQSKQERVIQRNRTSRLSGLLDWSKLIVNYEKSYQIAMMRAFSNYGGKYPSKYGQQKELLENGKIHTLLRTVSMQLDDEAVQAEDETIFDK